ncbi:DNA repair protein RadA [Amphiplicatus metriothermophilus]|uniref:DNA repair protein RadA n=1 Tax=Amphiplicatus metriothermophilus TaxID=1519374 RepID=A0A239PX41_9PROT|nr:DNA repair protein RadA [Amphiplicatus metriothermophilus]MBB5519924.1 DNA repair protein RadA/Sms [Amphiplicatus metriothermophilus]SNT74825.1 DNA replication and repair protein RadA [Amphiplicatus metriothermophilus]
MPRSSDSYVCQSCGAVYGKWAGRCDACGEWNTIVLEPVEAGPPGSLGAKGAAGKGKPVPLASLKGGSAFEPRLTTGNAEFDRACGGGLAQASALLIGGDPGVGKSTLLLQIAAGLARAGHSVAYISGEEAAQQIRLRARRLGLADAPVGLAAATALRDILATLKAERPEVVIIDSIQTLWSDALPAAPGTVTQVRACAQELVRFAKTSGAVMLLVGHVTKDGQIAGPRVVEHMVDAVLYFESEPGRDFRILRAVKNRFGAAHEIGVFEMTGAGLRPVPNPSELFLSRGGEPVSGAAVFAGIEGTRPVLVEFQALVSPSSLAAPRRAVVGWDSARLSMLLAVLDARCGLDFGRHDVFLNVAGGLRIAEPAADLAAAAALCSSLFDRPLPADRVAFGEVALSGAVRPVTQAEARLGEARKLGFSGALAPAAVAAKSTEIAVAPVETLADLVAWIRSAEAGAARPAARAR